MARPKIYDESLRAALLTDAAEVIAASGVEGLALRSLAARQSTSTNAVYSIFGSKPGLVAAVLAEADHSFTAAQAAVPETDDPLSDICELGRAYRAWALAHPALYTVMFGDRVPQPEDKLAQDFSSADGCEDGPSARRPLEAVVARLLDSGRFGHGDVEQLTLSIWATVHGMVSLELAFGRHEPQDVRDERYDRHLAALARAWRA